MKRRCCHSNRWISLSMNTFLFSMHSFSFNLFQNIHGVLFEVEICLFSTFQETVGSHLKRYLKSFLYIIMFCEKKTWLFPFLDSPKHSHSRRQPGRISARPSLFSISQPTKLFHKVCITRCSMSLWLYPLFWVFSLILF